MPGRGSSTWDKHADSTCTLRGMLVTVIIVEVGGTMQALSQSRTAAILEEHMNTT